MQLVSLSPAHLQRPSPSRRPLFTTPKRLQVSFTGRVTSPAAGFIAVGRSEAKPTRLELFQAEYYNTNITIFAGVTHCSLVDTIVAW